MSRPAIDLANTTLITDLTIPQAADLPTTIKLIFEHFSESVCFGTRVHGARRKPLTYGGGRGMDVPYKGFVWQSYASIWRQIRDFSAGLLALVKPHRHHDLNDHLHATQNIDTNESKSPDPQRVFVAIVGENRPEWLISDLACLFSGIVVVAIPVTTSYPGLTEIISKTHVSLVIASPGYLSKHTLLQQHSKLFQDCPTLLGVCVMDQEATRQGNIRKRRDNSEFFSVDITLSSQQFVSWSDVVAFGNTCEPISSALEQTALATVSFTSGSTGSPKGVMLSNARIKRVLSSQAQSINPSPFYSLSLLPLAFLAERQSALSLLSNGGGLGFCRTEDDKVWSTDMEEISVSAQQNPSNLFSDLKMFQPTVVISIPHFFNMLYQRYQLRQEQSLEESSLSTDQAQVHRQAHRESLSRIRDLLGNRVQYILIGSAPIKQHVLEFLRQCFQCQVINAYGITEIGGITTNNRIHRGVSIKLRDLPDLGYFVTDKPHPRGELLVKTPDMMNGYFGNPEATKAAFDEEGWFITGDVGILKVDTSKYLNIETEKQREDGPKHFIQLADGSGITFELIDRRKHIFKLANGQFIAAEYLEATYCQLSPLITQMYIHQDSSIAFIACVIVVDVPATMSSIKASANSAHIKESEGKDDCKISLKSIKGHILEQLGKIGLQESLHIHEIPSAVVILDQPFSASNGCLTASGKLNRPLLATKYADALNSAINLEQAERTSQLEELYNCLSRSLSFSSLATMNNDSFPDLKHSSLRLVDLGYDSLSTAHFISMLYTNLKVSIPLKLVQELTISELVHYIRAQELTSFFPSLASLALDSTFALDLALSLPTILTDETKESVAKTGWRLPSRIWSSKDSKDIEYIMLTGATGFLGRHLLHQLVEYIASNKTNALVLCLVRPCDEFDQSNSSSSSNQDQLNQHVLDRLSNALITARLGWSDTRRDGSTSSSSLEWQWTDIDQDLFTKRVIAIPGDMSLPFFGLDRTSFIQLSKLINGSIYHIASIVDWNLPYSKLRKVNVEGCLSIIELAAISLLSADRSMSSIPCIHYVSSATVTKVVNVLSQQQGKLDKLLGTFTSYALSKYIAEQLFIRGCKKYKFDLSIHRPAMIGASQNNFSNENQLIDRLICGMLDLGAFPASDHIGFQIASVNDIAWGIVRKSQDQKCSHEVSSQEGCLFHDYSHVQDYLSYEMIGLFLRSQGFDLYPETFKRWLLLLSTRAQLEAKSTKNDSTPCSLVPFLPYFLSLGSSLAESNIPPDKNEQDSDSSRKVTAILKNHLAALINRGALSVVPQDDPDSG